MTDITELAPAMKAAAEKASPGDWVKESGDGWDAICSNDDQANSGFIIAHFVGPDSASNREFMQLANPANVLALVEALEKAQQKIKAHERAEFTWMNALSLPDDASRDDILPGIQGAKRRITELEDKLSRYSMSAGEADQRIAELESRTVTVKLPPTIWYEHDDYAQEIAVLEKSRVLQALTAAGIKWEAE